MWRVLGALEGAPKKSKNGYEARCPAHEDGRASLSIGTGLDGRVLLKCHAGCPPENVVAALGLSLSDLFERNEQGNPVRRFQLVDRKGAVLAVHVREDAPGDKRMWWEAHGKPGLNGTPLEQLPLYRLPDVLARPGEPVIVCEGEKAADALADIGLLAVGTVTGASGTPSEATLEPLHGREVWLWPDNDEPGRGHMAKIALRLKSDVRFIQWPDAPPKGDAADYVAGGGTATGVALLVVQPAADPDEFEAVDLINERLAEPRWAVPGILPEGVALLAGKSKLGKSWLALDVALAIAEGGMAWNAVAVEQGDVYYLALEDSKRRLQDRLRTLRLGNVPRGLTLRIKSPRADEGGIDKILDWLNRHPRARLVIIDVLGKFRPKEANARRLYDLDYEAIGPIAEVARQRGVCILVICHCNKLNPDDPVDSVSGTTGLVGAADAICILRRERGKADASLFVVGRDVEEQDLAFKNTLEKPNRRSAWELLPGDASLFRMSEQRRELVDALHAVPGMAPAEIAAALGKPVGNVRNLLFHMVRDGEIRLREGRYYSTNANVANALTQPVSPISTVSSISPVSDVSAKGQKPVISCRVCGNELQDYLQGVGLHYDCVEEMR